MYLPLSTFSSLYPHVCSQTCDLRCLLNISKMTWPPGSPSLQSLIQGMARPLPSTLYPGLCSPRAGQIFPRDPSLYNPHILATLPFVPLASWMLYLVPYSSLTLLLSSVALDSVCLWLCSPFYLQ